MTKNELEPVRNLLMKSEHRHRGVVDSLKNEVSSGTEMLSGGNLSNEPVEDRAERGSNSSDEDVTIGLLELESARLEEITAALDRIKVGTFGKCEGCTRSIGNDRIKAIPFTRLCIACARKEQRQ